MLNCPGVNPDSSAGATACRSTVTVSRVSRRRPRTRNRRGTTAAAGSATWSMAVDVQQLQAVGLQPPLDDLGKPFHQFIAQVVILLALVPQTLPIQGDGARQFRGPGVEVPAVGRKEPGPSQHVPLVDRLDRHAPARGNRHLQRHRPVADEVEGIRLLTFLEDVLAAVEAAVSRMARTSSVMSMPTGHQVMHRPQPTQPDVPNWSIQVASLCVSHWRYREAAEARMLPPCT